MNNNTVLKDMESGIYQLRNKVNGKVYVGRSVNMRKREKQHLSSLRDGEHYNDYLQRSFVKYGENNFIFETLEYCGPEELNERERYWITTLGSEYSGKGYNAAYAVTLFERYKLKGRVNRSKRKAMGRKQTQASKDKHSAYMKKRFSDVSERKRQSLAKSSIDEETIANIKRDLYYSNDVNKEEISERYRVSINTVSHIACLASHSLIEEQYNFVIKNKVAINEARKNKVAIRMWREGCSYNEIGCAIGCHHRTVIRRLKNLKSVDDDRCRLNVINRSAEKKASLVLTLNKMGYNDSQASTLLGTSRSYICSIRNNGLNANFNNLNEARGKVKPHSYSLNRYLKD